LDRHGLFSCSFDRTIILWNPKTGEKIRTIQVPYDAVKDLIVIDNEVYSAGNDRVIISWNINTGSQVKFIVANSHSNTIMCFASRDQIYFTGSQDTTVIQWSANSTLPLRKYASRPLILRQIGIWKNFVISAGEDTEIRMWDTSLNSIAQLAVYYGHSRPVNCIQIVGDTFFSGSIDKTIRHWSLHERVLIRILNGNNLIIFMLRSRTYKYHQRFGCK
jgi:WD40 repeat protein